MQKEMYIQKPIMYIDSRKEINDKFKTQSRPSRVVINSEPTIDGMTLDRACSQKKRKSTCDLSPCPREIRANRIVAFNRTRAENPVARIFEYPRTKVR